MMWGQPWAAWLLIPVLLGLGLELWRRRSIATRFPHISRVWAGKQELDFRQRRLTQPVRWGLWLGLGLMVAALAKPRLGSRNQTVFDPASDVVVAMDLSRSMLATDVRPSRLEHARLLGVGMLDRLVGVRVALVPFAGTAFVQLPLSLDYQILIETLDTLEPDNFPRGGTDFSAMLREGMDALGEGESRNGRYLIVISDGETSDAQWREVLPQLVERGIQIIAVGVGTTTGAVIPAADGGVIVDASGAEVFSRYSPTVLEALAEATGGRYLTANTYVALADVLAELSSHAPMRAPLDDATPVMIERYQWCLLPGVLLLLLSYWREVPYRPHHRRVELAEPESDRRVGHGGMRGAVTTLTVLAALGLALPRVSALDGDENRIGPNKRPSSPVDGQSILLTNRIVEILNKREPIGIDYAGFVIDSMGYIETKLRIREKPPLVVISDAMAAVETGRTVDAEAADWDRYAGLLERLRVLTLAPAKVYAAESVENLSLEALLELAEAEQDKKRRGDRTNEEDDGMEIPDDVRDRPSRKVEASAFGNLMTDELPAAEEETPARRRRPLRFFGQPGEGTETDLALPLHRLGQIKSADSPARLYQLMESEDLPPPSTGDDW
ncbi:vWA domain-containing protein [Synoicihabitans lomoniglobus]|uniref:VWA domain-containing protein n=1 Tax=Synoicihabitans lomoniglobus TaxID=2909285 RepID=A0AAF0I6B4_9BACT|nr:VWA domain-containing protein [Opitutaceae bacterium LMO-M01]WED66001.1 VWA domain-containing protein [Opitutaceae bacterium LMO-M01]